MGRRVREHAVIHLSLSNTHTYMMPFIDYLDTWGHVPEQAHMHIMPFIYGMMHCTPAGRIL